MGGYFKYNTDIFDDSTIAKMVKHFQTLIENLVTDPQQHLSDSSFLSEDETMGLTSADFPESGLSQKDFESLILKLNSHDTLHDEKDPLPSVTGSVNDALRLGCAAVGFTIYPGSSHCNTMYEQLREIAEEAKDCGLAVVVWSYPRGSDISKEGETAIDVVAYAAQIAAQLGAHIIKVKLPTAHLEQAAAKKVYESTKIPIATLAERVRHVVQSSFDGRRIVIFSGGAKSEDAHVFEEARAIRDGGGFGSIIGRNSFQRPKAEALKFLNTIMGIYSGEIL